MVTTTLWVVISVIVAFALGSRPLGSVGFVLASYALVPLVAGDITILFRPGDYALLAAFVVFLTNYKDRFFLELKSHPLLNFLVCVVALYSVVARVIGVGGFRSSIITVLHVVVFPYLVYLIVCASLKMKDNHYKMLLWVLVPLTLFQLVLGWVQYQTGDAIFWESKLSEQWWWGSKFEVTQPMGTFGHWIPYAMFLSLALGINTLIKSRIIWFSLIIGTLYILTLTAARSGLIAFALVVFAVIIRELKSRDALRTLTVIMMFPVIVFAAINLFSSGFAETLRSKLENDGNSTTYRIEASQWFWDNWHNFTLTGLPAGLDLRESGVLNSSLENAFYFYAVAFGMLSTVLLAVLFASVTLGTLFSKGQEKLTGLAIALAFGISTFTYGAFGASEYSTLMLFWIAQAFAQHRFGQDHTDSKELFDEGAVSVVDGEFNGKSSSIKRRPPKHATGQVAKLPFENI